jgi:predicted secreted Zn-dependent protease
MWAWLKAGAVLLVSVLLMGSKIIIEVPAGGSIESSSGLFACAAGEVCTIEVNEGGLTETFTAIADPGFAFHSWADGPGALCAGSSDPHCTELGDSDISGSGGVAGRRAHVRTLTPAFTAEEAVPASHDDVHFSVSSVHTTRYYEISGSSQQEVWAQLQGAANPLSFDHEAGAKPVGQADFHYQYSFHSRLGDSPSSCRVAGGELAFRFETVLPQLGPQGRSSEQLNSRWLSFRQQVTDHEAAHHAIYRQLVTQLPQLLAGIGDVPCDKLSGTVEVAVTAAVDDVRQASIDYDEYYGGEDHVASLR